MTTTRWWLLALLAAGALAFSAGRWSATSPAMPSPLQGLAEFKLDWLGLTPAQAAQMAEFEPILNRSIQAGCEAQCAARCRLVRALTADVWDPVQARVAVEAMCAAHRETELATLDYLAHLHNVLTPEQRKRLMTRVGACLCENCAAGRDTCCIPKGENP